MPREVVYSPAERPDAEVLVDGSWRPAEVRMWTQDEHGAWHAQLTWNKAPGLNHIDTFPASQVRPSQETDRGGARG